ncbi:hydroxymethylpyrimidine/phosphomethylpyrimidine kinase [Noviherbaspirillum humi]|uniref:hydroxymethylpyrimidine kinase n=1 Tax=Noviherbaspirillum humi TaxID=1688639 RepID=A0A239L6J6_9BURK|nr:hydroxymethylpyrimidine/phosphomethylpyrimidine kinase [Noviherbaspirillum humi]SNT26217.1 hydroxymethylpyrimidine/phosphomethylpyrimidine kinase [Noviherbaspirillum humi]
MNRPNVLILAGSDPSGGAGMQADIQAVMALGAHPLSVITVLTAQDNDRVHAVMPVPADMVAQQAQALASKMEIAAVKLGIIGNRANGEAIAALIRRLRQRRPDLPVVLDPVLASGHGNALAIEDPVGIIRPLLPLASVVLPNLPEAARLCPGADSIQRQAALLLEQCPNVLVKGGHGEGDVIVNRWFSAQGEQVWQWPRLPGGFHGTGCTLASALAALLARGIAMREALERAQAYCEQTLLSSYAIAEGQRIPNRWATMEKTT